MTDLNKPVSQSRNKTLSFWAFEKERWKKIGYFIMRKKMPDEKGDIGVFPLAWKIYKRMKGEVKKTYTHVNTYDILAGAMDGVRPYVDLLVYGALPALLTGSEKAKMVFLGFALLLAVQKILRSIFLEISTNVGFKFRDVYFNQTSIDRYKEMLDKPRAFFVINMPETISSLVHDVTRNEAQLLRNCGYILYHFFTFLVAAASLFMVSPVAMLTIVLISLIRVEYDFYWSNYFREKNNKNRMFATKVYAINRDVLRNSPLVQDGLTMSKECSLIGHRLNWVTRNEIKVMFAEAKNSLAGFCVGEIMVSLLAAFLAVADILKTGDIGRFALISGAIYYMTGSISTIRHIYLEICVKCRNTIVDTEKQLITPKAIIRKCGENELDEKNNQITLKKVEFAYPKIKDITKIEQNTDKIERGEEVLRDISLEIKKGGVTVIAGTSGQGKSTLMSIFRHYYYVTDGEILLGKENVQNLSDKVINKQIAFVDQNVHFFDNTLLYNVKYFNQNASEEEVQRVLTAVGLSKDVARFKDGVYHRIGQDGRALSGGQRQRLALARTFLTDRPIVIMDEPTTGLDQVLSFKVMKSLRQLAKMKTVILVTHNPTEIALADRVLIVQKGKIVADGEPMKLIETSDFLKKSMTKQDIISKQQLFANA
ncbi:MAG: ABC transporter ATP-binding protein [Alphaproteobacteria bacterium]|nr:ABC transporter ATP-binding protein [Alphaproteobacteria bacterium]